MAERQVQVSQGQSPTETPAPPTVTLEPPAATPAPPFDGAAFDSAHMANLSLAQMQMVVAGTQVGLRLYPNPAFEGSSGCNTCRGKYLLDRRAMY